jgi:hypothetical protein
MITTILLYAGIFLGGLVAGLKVIAPLTATKIDDKVLEYGEDGLKLLEALGVKVPADVEIHAVAATKA